MLQICGLEWNRHHKEILSGHGFGIPEQNHLSLWKYPSLTKIAQLQRHFSRVINLSQVSSCLVQQLLYFMTSQFLQKSCRIISSFNNVAES